jgi:hypothetical protein
MDISKKRNVHLSRDNFFTADSYKNLGKGNIESINLNSIPKQIPEHVIQEESEQGNDFIEKKKIESIEKGAEKISKESFFTNYALKNNFFRSKVFSIGFFSVFITILAFYVILEITNLTSIVFYNLVEAESGDSEILLTKDLTAKKINSLFQYDEESEIEKDFKKKINDVDDSSLNLNLTQKEIDDFLVKANNGDSEAAMILIRTNNLSIEKGLELLPSLLEGIGLVEPEKLRKSLFQKEYVSHYSELLNQKFDKVDLSNNEELQKKESLTNFMENNKKTGSDDNVKKKYTYFNSALNLTLPTISDLEVEFERMGLMGVSGRWILPVNITNPDWINSETKEEDKEYGLQANIIVTDIANEIKSGIGRNSDLKNVYSHFDLQKYENKEDVFEKTAVITSTIASYLRLDEEISIQINFDYIFSKLGFQSPQFENFLDIQQFIDYFSQIEFDKNNRKFFLKKEKEIKVPESISFIDLETLVTGLNQGLDQVYSGFDQINGNNELLEGLPFPAEFITSQFLTKENLDDFIETFWENTYKTFLDQIAELINLNLSELTNLNINYTVQGEISSAKGLYNGLLGNVVFLDRKGISKKIISDLEKQITDFQNSINNILNIDGVPTTIINNFIEPYLKENIQNLRDIVKFVFEGNAEKDLFQSTSPNSILSNNQDQLEVLRQSDFKGLFSYFPLTQIYSPNKDLIYSNLNIFEEKADSFSDQVAMSFDEKFSYTYTNPLKITLSFMNNLHIFIKVLLINIVIVLGVINVIIIYSLTSLAVNEKNFEFGIIRALGLPKSGLLKLIGNP